MAMMRVFIQYFVLCCVALTCFASTLKFKPKIKTGSLLNHKYQDQIKDREHGDLRLIRESEFRFQSWIKEHGKTYDLNEYTHRLAIFRQNIELIEQVNAEDRGYKLGLNKFADLTFAEFRQQYLISKPQNCSATRKGNHVLSSAPLPVAVDWRKKGFVSPVKNQGHCGSCWTFSTTGAMEAHTAMTYGVMYSLSEQQLVDCAQAFDTHGCAGGLPSHAFEYIHYNGGLMLERDYPYKAKDGKCKFDRKMAVAFVKEIVNITANDENMLADAVANAGPVSIAFQVASDFHMYKSGVYSSKVCKSGPMNVNHAVLAVGYNVTSTGTEYWIVKNSWGTSFGIDGYFYIERGKNMCGLADCASYPVVTNN